MRDEDFARAIGFLYDTAMDLRKNDDFEVNPPQAEKFLKVWAFFQEAAERLNGEVEDLDIEPKGESGDISANFIVFDLSGEEISKFCEALSFCSAVSIDSYNDGRVCISCVVPEVFVRKQ